MQKGTSKYNFNLINGNSNQLSLLQLQDSQLYVAGDICLGKFTSVKNDFSLETQFEGQFQNLSHWNLTKREKVKKFRFVICTLALIALSLSVMSRSLFNISIIAMTKSANQTDQLHNSAGEYNVTELTMPHQEETTQQSLSEDIIANENHELVSVFTINDNSNNEGNGEDGLSFDWSVEAKNFLLSAFFIGYAPSMFFSGGIAEQYGSMLLLSICVVSSVLINIFTPYMAAFSYYSLAASRIVLGILQGPLVPACYDIFNKWLTITEMSVFVPLVKVSMAVGTLAGTSLPGMLDLMGHPWTYNFYIGGLISLIWTLLWFPLATSTPQTNKWIENSELERIMRKKSTALAVIKLSVINSSNQTTTISGGGNQERKQSSAKTTPNSPVIVESSEKTSIPWLSIITSPSVLVLTFVKFTYNLGMDFLFIMSPTYLREIHHISTGTVSLITGLGCVTQITLITFVGSLSTYVVRNETLGFSRTIWRKIFQGTSNFSMAFLYYMLANVGLNQLNLVAGLFILVSFFWMFGAGGESMVPYDLSPKYPATIMGFAHSLSILSGFALPQVGSLVLGDSKGDPARWSLLFYLISIALALGGLLFILIIKAKPFMASERAKYDEAKAKENSLRNGDHLSKI